MPIANIANGEAASSVRSKLNAAIAEVNVSVVEGDPLSLLIEDTDAKIFTAAERTKLGNALVDTDIGVSVPALADVVLNSDIGTSVPALADTVLNTDIGVTVAPFIKHNYNAVAEPTANNDNTEDYSVGSTWYYNNVSYRCVDATTGAAVWQNASLTADDLGTAAFEDTGFFASSAQGMLANTAIQPEDIDTAVKINSFITTGTTFATQEDIAGLSSAWADITGKPNFGTAAFEDIEFFATAAQGTKADSAMQVSTTYTGGEQTTILTNIGAATAAQGAKADSAVQPFNTYAGTTEGAISSSHVIGLQHLGTTTITNTSVVALKGYINSYGFTQNNIPFTDSAGKLTADSNFQWTPLDNILKAGSTLICDYGAGNTDITGLVSGTTSGSLVESAQGGHLVVGVRSNSNTDTFSIVSKSSGNPTYNKLLAMFKADGETGIGRVPRSGYILDVNGQFGATSVIADGAAITNNLTSGKIGVGKSPVKELDVSGEGKVSSHFEIGGNITIDGNLTLTGSHNLDLGSLDTVENLTVTNTLTAKYISTDSTLESSALALKENISPITGALDAVVRLTGITYDRKDGSAKKESGFVAEEVQKVLPNVVGEVEEGVLGIKYTKLIAYLVESIKELQNEIEVLKAK